jgi:hypothetical protein
MCLKKWVSSTEVTVVSVTASEYKGPGFEPRQSHMTFILCLVCRYSDSHYSDMAAHDVASSII